MGQGPNLIRARGRISFGRILENNTITCHHLELGPCIYYILTFPILPPVIENESLISDIIASPKEGLVTDVTASPILLHVSENNSLIPDITESTILLKILHTPFGLYLMLLHHRFCRKFCKLLLAKY